MGDLQIVQDDREPIPGLIEGRICHYVIDSGPHRPAIITEVIDNKEGIVSVTIFLSPNDAEVRMFGSPIAVMTPVSMDNEDKRRGTWHWTEHA